MVKHFAEGIARPRAVDTCLDPSMAFESESAMDSMANGVSVGSYAASTLLSACDPMDQKTDGQHGVSFDDGIIPESPPEEFMRMIVGQEEDQIDPLDRVPVTPDDEVASPHTPENIMRSVQMRESSLAIYGFQPNTPVFGPYTPPGTPPNTPLGSPLLTPQGTPPGTPPDTPLNSPREDFKMHDADDESTQDSNNSPGNGEAQEKQMLFDMSDVGDVADATSSVEKVNKRKWGGIFETSMVGPRNVRGSDQPQVV